MYVCVSVRKVLELLAFDQTNACFIAEIQKYIYFYVCLYAHMYIYV